MNFAPLLVIFVFSLPKPFVGYEDTFDGSGRTNYFKLLDQAISTETIPEQPTNEHSYFEAGKRVIDLSDILIAVWNGKKAAGLGGTGDAVEYAKSKQKKVFHINPDSLEFMIIAD